eukprot:1750261-Rhodomonas_salina.1
MVMVMMMMVLMMMIMMTTATTMMTGMMMVTLHMTASTQLDSTLSSATLATLLSNSPLTERDHCTLDSLLEVSSTLHHDFLIPSPPRLHTLITRRPLLACMVRSADAFRREQEVVDIAGEYFGRPQVRQTQNH